jgi:hypothetical protein
MSARRVASVSLVLALLAAVFVFASVRSSASAQTEDACNEVMETIEALRDVLDNSDGWGRFDAMLDQAAEACSPQSTTTTAPPTTAPPTTAPPTTAPPTTAPPTTQPPTTTVPPSGAFPNPSTTGTPSGWTPTQTINGNYTVSTAGAVVQDLRINGTLAIRANNVTVRRVHVQGGIIDIGCRSGILIEDSTVAGPAGGASGGAIGYGGYTARRVEITQIDEGFRVGCSAPVVIENSFVRIVPPSPCGDWHGDGLQGYNGGPLTIRNTTIDFNTGSCGGTSAFFFPDGDGNRPPVNIDGLLVKGGGYPFRNGQDGFVRGLRIVNNSWSYGPMQVKCQHYGAGDWEAAIVTIDSNYRVTSVVRSQPCNTSSS